MHINDLPEDILIIVLKHACHMDNYSLSWLKTKLPLLTTCRLWRTISMPFLFGIVSLNYSNKEVLRKRFAEGDSIAEPNDKSITTIADIIAAAGQTNLVKHVSITVFHFANPLPGLFAVLNHLGGLSKKWPSVKSLEMRLEYNNEAYNMSSRDMSKFDRAMPSVVKSFTLLLPGVVDLKFSRYGNNYVASLLYSQLLAAYSGQTTRLAINQPLSLTHSFVLNKLAHLTVNFKIEKACQLPVILADTLVSLSLREIPYRYNWSTFATEGEPNVIEFSNLATLDVKYAVNTDYTALINSGEINKPQWPMLHFPKLKCLKLVTSHAEIPLLVHSMLPKELCLRVNGSIKTLTRLEMHPFPVLKSLSMIIYYRNSDLHINPFTAINKMASKVQCTTDIAMYIYRDLNKEVLSNISCSALTRLTIHASIDGDTIPILLQGLPKLKDLALLTITEVDEQTCSIVTEYVKHKVNNAQPLNSSIENLVIKFFESDLTNATTLVKYLLPRLPALSELRTFQIPALAIKEFVNEYKSYYPHLDTIKNNYICLS